MIDCLGGHTLMRTRLKRVPGCGCGVQESRVRAGETGKLKDGEIWRALSARRGFYFSCQSSVISENTSHTIWCSILHRSLLGCLYFPLLFFPTSSLIFPLISWPLLFRYFSLLNSSHLIFILSTTFFLILASLLSGFQGKKERRGGQGWGLLFLYQTHISCFYFIFIIFSSLVFVFFKAHPEGKPWVKLNNYLISKTFSSNHS